MLRFGLAILGIVITLGAVLYFWWVGSPFYAFQQVAMAIKDHDAALFEKYCNAPQIVDLALDDLIVGPALSTPNLSGFQSSVATGALAMAKSSVAKGAIESINKYFCSESGAGPTGYWQNFAPDAAIAAPLQSAPHAIVLAQATGGRDGLKDLLHAAGSEMSGEVTKLKTVAFNRMLSYIQNHPNTVPGRLLNCPPNERGAHAREMLEEYGLSQNNFKGLGGSSTTTDLLGHQKSTVGFNFFSPKINREITLEIELNKDPESGAWRIDRLSNIKNVMDQVEEFYDRDIHELVEYSLSGMSNNAMATDMKGMTERLKQNPAAQNILKKWNLNLR